VLDFSVSGVPLSQTFPCALSDRVLAFDPEWNTNGHQEKAVDLFVSWVKEQNVAGLQIEVRLLFRCSLWSSPLVSRSAMLSLRTNVVLHLPNDRRS